PESDEEVGPHPRRMAVDLALEPDRGPEDGGDEEPDAELDLEGDVHRCIVPVGSPGAGVHAARSRSRSIATIDAVSSLRIDLNADVGESLGPWPMGDDAALIPLVTSVNVACGFHAGDPLGIALTIDRAVRAG